ncbi:outer membrane lipoprotein-sorting protein [Thiohalobacter sp. IOR34]|uniref:outer membrane lipoprotein-sorting protein n=1 Tax=Thiohalobacter sp. IOR34 TaxID=3057176 RepID=UPI0025AF035E|nr:outer membrane lipoprotein-sorting protein [Thiohalobacter sp. IOR34]WJW75115.1 outer membrane lipoprotein-sorting protein [Thiohalobacter sp. IOR34]
MNRLILILLLPLCLLSTALAAETAEEKGLAIAEEMDRRDTGWGDQTARMEMILRNRRGDESRRQIRVRTLEVENDGDKSLTIFDHPRDVKGTAFLSYTHALKPDEQWLYLPALKRVKRIASRNKSGPFMGSEFAYEDMTSQEVPKYSYRFLREEEVGGRKTLVIERYPQYEYSGYTRQVVWIDSGMYRPVKVEFYDRKDSLLKTLTLSGYHRYLDRYWRPDEMHMINHQTGKQTTLRWSDYRFRTGLTSRDFDKNSLKRAH